MDRTPLSSCLTNQNRASLCPTELEGSAGPGRARTMRRETVTLLDSTTVREQVPWQGVLEALDEVVLLLNGQNVVTYASPSVASRLGYSPQELTGRSLGDVVHPDDLRSALRTLAEVASSGVVRTPMRVRRSEGGYVWLECSLTR